MNNPLSDESIITLYWNRNEQAIPETDRKYGPYCHRVAFNILADREDSNECVNDTWFQAWQAMPPDKPGILRSYLARISRNLALDRYRERSAAKRGGGETALALEELSECIPGDSSVESTVAVQELERSINDFIHSLPKRDGDIFLKRYFYMESVQALAAAFRISERNCLVILSRTRNKLKKHLEKEGYTV